MTLNVLVVHTRLCRGAAVILNQKRISYTFHSIGGRTMAAKKQIQLPKYRKQNYKGGKLAFVELNGHRHYYLPACWKTLEIFS